MSASGRGEAGGLRLERLDGFDAERGAWSGLAEASRNVFATPEFAETWWRHFGRGRRLLLTAARDGGGALVAVLPLYEWRSRPLRVLRFVGSQVGDELGPVARPGEGARVAEALRRAAAGADLLLAEHLPGGAPWRQALGGRVLIEEGSPVLRFPEGDWEAYWATLSRNMRQNAGRRERKLQREHDVRYRLCDDPSRLDADLETLFRLHDARWESTTNFGARRDFHRDWARVALDRGWLRLWLLEVDGAPAAAWYGFRYGDAESYYQSGRDPAWDSASVGLLVVLHSIRAAHGDGIPEYRFLRGDESYKYRFTDDPSTLETVGVALGARGTVALAGFGAARVARRAVRASARELQRSLRRARRAAAPRRDG